MTQQQQITPINQLRGQMDKMTTELESVLPDHITPKQFQRVAMTAIQTSPDLLMADRQSLFSSVMKAAQDGLLPDGREGALIIFSTKDRGTQQWVKKVQWMPMIGGVLKKIRQSGELATINANVVWDADQFDYYVDDDGDHILHRPAFGVERGNLRLVYAMAKTKDGSLYVEIMSPSDIQKVRNASKSKDRGPWVDWFEQMAKKSALHRLAKRLPLSTELATVVNRDEELYDFNSARDITPRPRAKSVDDVLAPRQQEEAQGSEQQQPNAYLQAQEGEA